MKTSQSLRSDITYVRCLTRAVLDGITSAPETTADGAFAPILTAALWTPTAIGAPIGVLTARLGLGGLVGSALGFGAGVAWISRGITEAVARSTMQKINSVRDARWLEKNPIDYA